MQIEGEFTIKMSAYELVALRDALGILSHEHQRSEGLTPGQIQATTAIYSTLDGFLDGNTETDDDDDKAARLNEEELQLLGGKVIG